jgi:hypothetical protein
VVAERDNAKVAERMIETTYAVTKDHGDDLHDDLVHQTKRQHLSSDVGTDDAHRSTAGELLGARQRLMEVRDR